MTYRVGHHSTSDDSTKYRPVDEIEYWKMARNPVNRFRNWVESNGWWSEDEETQLRDSIRKQVLDLLHYAKLFSSSLSYILLNCKVIFEKTHLH